VAEWANTGAKSLSVDTFTTYTPTLYFGKGFGDLPDAVWWARPLAVTGVFGYAIPSRSRTIIATADPDSGDVTVDNSPNPRFFNWGGSIQYSMPYLKTAVNDLGLPDFINHLIPIVEASLQTPVSNFAGLDLKTTGTINPGVLWVGNTFQVGVEAIVPVNRQSGTSVGVIAQLHLYLDDLFPTTIGKPIFGVPSPQQSRSDHEQQIDHRRAVCAPDHHHASERPRHSRPFRSTRRQHGKILALRRHALVHAEAGAGLQQCPSDECSRGRLSAAAPAYRAASCGSA
jgi:hypothetical protein